MAAYAALVSLMYIIRQIEHHPRPPISLDKTQVESLTEKVTFLQEFLEGYSHFGYSREADDLEIRIADAAFMAEDVIESHIADQILAGEKMSSNIDILEGLEKVVEVMDSIKKEVMEIKVKKGVQHHLLQRKSRRPSTGQNTAMVGFDDVLIEVMDKLIRGQLGRQIIQIVGMGGIGKTTLARNVYQNPVVVQHFDILVWVTVSQEYRMIEILSQCLQEDRGALGQMNDEYELGIRLYQRLSGRRYLIILDDIWDIQAWDKFRRFFPDNNNGSRIVITTRISNFQVTGSDILKMGFLDEDKSWSLFSKNVFGEEGFPFELKEIGKTIVENCRGLPLSIVVVGGLLAKTERTRECWESIAENLNSIVNSEDDENCLKILYMSYNHLPVYLKPCFLYMGAFEEDRNVRVSKLVKLWVSEGFLKPISGKSLEEIAGEYLKELINRNLVIVNELGSTGNIKYCNIHDLLRDLCLREAEKQRFYSVIRQHGLDVPLERRVVIPETTSRAKVLDGLQYMSLARSLICESTEALPLHAFRLLRIVSCSNFDYTYFLQDMFHLVNSRYLVLNARSGSKFSSLVCVLWNLHTLIVEMGEETAPIEIWNMSQLRHLEFGGGIHLPDPPCGDTVLVNLQMLGRIIHFKCSDEAVKRIPNIKKLEICYYNKFEEGCLYNLGHLHKLESLYCLSFPQAGDILRDLVFPNSLKKLTIANSVVYWEDMLEKIGSLPFLEKLILRFGSFKGGKWETVEGRFLSLKFLEIELCRDLECWMTESTHFPRLEHLVLDELDKLNEIPSDIGEMPTLKSIKLVYCTNPAIISARKILDEQDELYGEVGVHIRVQTKNPKQKEELKRLASPNFQFI